jgi:hypothetical protein
VAIEGYFQFDRVVPRKTPYFRFRFLQIKLIGHYFYYRQTHLSHPEVLLPLGLLKDVLLGFRGGGSQVLLHVLSKKQGQHIKKNAQNYFLAKITVVDIIICHYKSPCVLSKSFIGYGGHGLINYIDTKAKCRHLKKLTCKVALREVFTRVYRLEIQSVMLVFSTRLCELLPLSPSLWSNSLPSPTPLFE